MALIKRLNLHMQKLTAVNGNIAWLIFIVFFIASCNSKKSIPFPPDSAAIPAPVTRLLPLTAEQPLPWQAISQDTTQSPETKTHNLAGPLKVNTFQPLKRPVQPQQQDGDHIAGSGRNHAVRSSRISVYIKKTDHAI